MIMSHNGGLQMFEWHGRRRWVDFWLRFARFLPASLIYAAGIQMVVHGTVGKYEDTVVPDLSAMDAIQRYGNDHGV